MFVVLLIFFFKRNSLLPSKGIDMVAMIPRGMSLHFSFLHHSAGHLCQDAENLFLVKYCGNSCIYLEIRRTHFKLQKVKLTKISEI